MVDECGHREQSQIEIRIYCMAVMHIKLTILNQTLMRIER